MSYFRKSRGYTQIELAEILGIDRSHMSAIELANVGVSLDVIFKLCEALSVSEKQLFDFRLS
ncbi:MAG: helix-turn-helix transcriptional regulator [Ruminococcaceae bacterium]|nr:helix-turn-helix transcriptional regulator [Oscillospiraceae bacterium]